MTRTLIVLAMGLLLTSCSGVDIPEYPGTVLDSAGISLIDLPSDSEVGPILALTIDSAWAGTRELDIAKISDAAVGPRDQVLVLDGKAARVHIRSSSNGSWIPFGRPGEGRGEFSSRGLLGNLVLTDSSFLVPDLDLQRITDSSFEGTVLGVRPYPFMVYAVDWRSHPDGGLVFRALDPGGDHLIRWVDDQVDTLYSFSIVVDHPNLLLPPSALWDLTGDGRLVSGRSDQGMVILHEYRVDTPNWIARWPISGSVLGSEQEAHLLDLVVESVRVNQPGCTEETLEAARAATAFAERTPVLAGILTSPDGEVWVRRAKAVLAMDLEALRVGSAAGFGGGRWDVLSEEGLLRAQVQLPTGFSPLRISGPWLYAVQANKGEGDTLVRVRIDIL